jgi:type 1 glutamine amidotransferase
MSTKRILTVLGGTWHNFDGFTTALTPVFESAGHIVESTYDLEALTHLHQGRYDLVLLYTCLGMPQDPATEPAPPTDAQAESLVKWVRDGGALLAAHAATVSSQANPKLKALMGGVFIEHPPQFTFTVYPLFGEHPITAGIDAFTAHDELYIQAYDETVAIHMAALDRGIAYPMVWSKHEGTGRVAHVALGHGPEVWRLQPYQQLMLQAVSWLTG